MNTSHRVNSPQLLDFARQLRAEQSKAERIVWSRLRNRQFLNLRFRRQHPIEGYIIDFLCVECMLVLELDGAQHFEGNAENRDVRRNEQLMALRFNIVRIPTLRVVRESDLVLRWIEDVIVDNALLRTRPSPQPSPGVPGEGAGRRFDLR
jgi:very-short-patch-repair endonuclease